MAVDERKFIVVEGPIGVGKTTLARRLANTLGHELFLEQVADNPFLDRFYADRRNMALPTQLFFLLQRSRQIAALRQSDMFKLKQVADFLPQKDQLFARLNLSDDEYALYQQVYAQLNMAAPPPDIVIYLQASTSVLIERVRRRATAFEKAITRDYLEKVCIGYVKFFHHYDASPLLIVNTNDFDLADGTREYQLLLEHIHHRASGRHYLNPSASVV